MAFNWSWVASLDASTTVCPVGRLGLEPEVSPGVAFLWVLGASVDWSRERFTMDDGCSRAVREVFIQLFDEGLIYRGTRLVNWDPVLHTAISDLEVVSEEEEGSLWHFRYPLVDGSGHLVVATTRPETMLGDTAVAVHPQDQRYKALIGKSIALPLTPRIGRPWTPSYVVRTGRTRIRYLY